MTMDGVGRGPDGVMDGVDRGSDLHGRGRTGSNIIEMPREHFPKKGIYTQSPLVTLSVYISAPSYDLSPRWGLTPSDPVQLHAKGAVTCGNGRTGSIRRPRPDPVQARAT